MQEEDDPRLVLRDFRAGSLEPLDLRLASGECVSLRGPSGSGKTRFLRAVADLDPHSGESFLRGRERRTVPPPQWRRRVGLVPAESAWWADTVAEHLEDPGAAAGPARALGLDLDEVGEWPVTRLSSGERQRLALARCLALGPEVVLLDEPCANLDEETAGRVEALIARQREEGGLAVIWVGHDRPQLERVASRHLCIAGAAIVEAP